MPREESVRKSGRDLSASTSARFVGLLVVLWILLSLASYSFLVVPRQRRFDLYPRWVGARAALRGESPYAQSVTWSIQEGMFGRRLEPFEDQQRFAYAPPVIWLLLPLWLLPFPLTASLWCGLSILLLLLTPMLVVHLMSWQIRPAALGLLLVSSTLLYRYPINAYLIGQFVPFVFACIIVALWSIMHGRPTLAGLSLILAMVRPEVAALPVVALLALACQMKQPRIVVTWLLGMFVLWLLTRLWIGPWEKDFIDGIAAYVGYSHPLWPPGLIGNAPLSVALAVLILSWSAWMVRELGPLEHISRPVWILAVVLLASLLLLPQTGNYTLLLGLFPAWLMLWVTREKTCGWVPVLAVFTSPWVFSSVIDPPSWEQLIIPLILSAGTSLYWRSWKNKDDA